MKTMYCVMEENNMFGRVFEVWRHKCKDEAEEAMRWYIERYPENVYWVEERTK